MGIQQFHDWFTILQDKFNSPYFTEDEIDLFINRAQIEYVNSFLPEISDTGNNVEFNQRAVEQLEPLIYQLAPLTMNGSGLIGKTTIQGALNTASSKTEPYMAFLAIAKGELPVKFTRHNDWYQFLGNTFKRPSPRNPRYKMNNNSIQFAPIDVTEGIVFTVLKQPQEVNLQASIDCELPERTHNKIIAIGIELASIASRDEALAKLNELQSK
jgi:hypothetical protein